MPHEKSRFAMLLAIVVFVSGGCSAASNPLNTPPDSFAVGDEISIVSESTIDSLNLYGSAVKVKTTIFNSMKGHVEMTCSGVLVHSRLVLTAGHCVCDARMPKPPEPVDTTIIDRRAPCARTATITFLTYKPMGVATEEVLTDAGDSGNSYTGVVRPHEGLRIIYKEVMAKDGRRQKSTAFSHADLAAIILNESLEGKVAYVKLATDQVRRYEQVILVGYGVQGIVGEKPGMNRRYGENYVVSIKSDGTTFQIGKQVRVDDTYDGESPSLMRSSGSYALQGDSGGPCFRKADTGVELVGIAKSFTPGDFMLSSYTSTPTYLEWINEKISESKASPTD
ncbi:trypsin-like serine protease [Hyalangium sp.]|uniref:trypsin-like serine protease n=1 Tax=Hyalangium sp. TaxID=2028555 RepID=UPI002D24227D|nr:trypsin-like serine protease [Hyalangium sp.]HYI02261.1 trypsin-like serine protease [Hyalangium sp.]